MRIVRALAKPLCWLLVLAMVNLSLPHGAARAAMISTETVVEGGLVLDGERARVRAFLEREDVRRHMIAGGIDPDEALRRAGSLSDREVAEIAQVLDELPAGGFSGLELAAFAGLILAAALIVAWLIIGAVTGTALLFRENQQRNQESGGHKALKAERATR
jgi:hypothetical protein